MSNDISEYVREVEHTKMDGFKLEKRDSHINKRAYLQSLRKLSKKNDFYVRSVKSNYNESMKKNEYKLFSQMINSGLIDTKKNKHEIIDYYYKHQDDINASGVIQNFLDEDAKLKALKEAQRKKRKTKKMLEEEKIKRLREIDRREQEELEKRLQLELEEKKLKVREEQKRELAS
jgi:hypothetical protein